MRQVPFTRVVTVIFALSAWIGQALPAPVSAQQEVVRQASASSMVDPFESYCATCHGNRSAESLAPTRQTLRQMDPERVLAAITTGPMGTYAEFNSFSKWVLFVNMWVGRLEVMAVLIFLQPGVWRGAHWRRFAHQMEEVA
mgnify:CR=1 FL=1